MKTLLLAAAAVLTAVVLVGLVCGLEAAAAILAAGALGLGYSVRDAKFKQIHALPNGAATTQGAGLDLGISSRSDLVADHEVIVTAPALTTGELADGQTITYSLEHDTVAGFGTVATIPGFAQVALQTGAGGAGAAAQIIRLKLPTSVKSFIRLKTVKAGASNASTKNGTLELAF